MRISDWSSDVCSSDLLTPLTACSAPRGVRKVTLRSSTSSRAMILAPPRIERIAQAVADRIEGQHGDRQQDGGENQHPARRIEHGGALVDQQAPARQRLLNAEAEEGERAFHDDVHG